jgi:hypothetical protein
MRKLIEVVCFTGAVLFLLLIYAGLAVCAKDRTAAPLFLGTPEDPEIVKQRLERNHMLERKFGKHFGGLVTGWAPLGIGTGVYDIYGVKRHKTEREGKILSTVTGVLVGPEKDKRYKSIKVHAEINSKSEGIIKRSAELNIDQSASSRNNESKIQGVSYTNFEWTLPSDIDLRSLQIVEAEGH